MLGSLVIVLLQIWQYYYTQPILFIILLNVGLGPNYIYHMWQPTHQGTFYKLHEADNKNVITLISPFLTLMTYSPLS